MQDEPFHRVINQAVFSGFQTDCSHRQANLIRLCTHEVQICVSMLCVV